MCSIYLKVCKHHQSSFSANVDSWGQFSYITLLNLECGVAFCHRPRNTFLPATVLGIFYIILCCTYDPTVLSATDLGRSWNMSVFVSVAWISWPVVADSGIYCMNLCSWGTNMYHSFPDLLFSSQVGNLGIWLNAARNVHDVVPTIES